MDEKIIEQLKEKFPDRKFGLVSSVRPFTEDKLEFVVMAPIREEWKRWQVEVSNETTKAGATERLVKQCTKFPEAKELDALIRELPGLVTTVGSKILEMGGANQEAELRLL